MAALLLAFGLAQPFSLAQDYGSNWTAEYYSNRQFSGSPATTQSGVAAVNFNWGAGSPIPGTIAENEFSVRFSAAPFFFAGAYQFTVTADDGARVSIDGAVVPEFANNYVTSLTFSREMTAGNHNLVVEYVEGQGNASVQFYWTQTSGESGNAAPPAGTPTLPTATMTGARGLAVRSGPYLGATLLRVALPDQAYPVSARNLDEGLYPWYYISLPSGVSGWASGRFLTLNVDPNTIPIQATVFDTLDNPPETGVTAAPRAYMNIRRRPSERTEQLGQVPIGERVPLLNRTAQSGENYWYQVRYEGIVGWIYAPYVSTNGPIDDVPIR